MAKPSLPAVDEAPSCIKDGLTFFPIPDVSDADCAFGVARQFYFDRHNLPKVPRQYEDEASRLFFQGGKFPDTQPDIDQAKAGRFLRSRLCSWAPPHESKTATVAYALWVWNTPADKRRA